jgi:hypothetical protein
VEAELRVRLLLWMRETDDPLLQGPVASPYYYESLRRLGAAAGTEQGEGPVAEAGHGETPGGNCHGS